MILPTKGIAPQHAVMTVAANALRVHADGMTPSELWRALKAWRSLNGLDPVVSYEWFVLALDVLFVAGAVSMEGGRIVKTEGRDVVIG
jgi:hypothetical protein